MSSRNQRLSPAERQQAVFLYSQLLLSKERLLAGEPWSSVLADTKLAFLTAANCQLEYFALLHPETFEIFDTFRMDGPQSLCIAAFVGQVRLIDNLPIIA